MSFSRRDMFKAVGLGGMSLVAGATLEKVSAGEHQPDAPSNAVPLPTWQHPDADKIEAFSTLTGGYPSFFKKFSHVQNVRKGDLLKVNYHLEWQRGREVNLYRVYDVNGTCTVLGVSIQGLIVYDANHLHHLFAIDSTESHHLAMPEELTLNVELTNEYYDNPKD